MRYLPHIKTPARRGRHQRGAVLVVGLIMLLLITLIAAAAVRMSTTHVQVVGNEQFKTEATMAANYALDLVLNDKNFTDAKLSTQPVQVALAGAAGTDAPVKSLTATYTDPECQRYRFIKKQELVKKVANQSGGYTYTVAPSDAACIAGMPSTGITIVNPSAGSLDDNSLCVTTLWDVAATVEDDATGAAVTLHQGIEMRMEISDAENKCKP